MKDILIKNGFEMYSVVYGLYNYTLQLNQTDIYQNAFIMATISEEENICRLWLNKKTGDTYFQAPLIDVKTEEQLINIVNALNV